MAVLTTLGWHRIPEPDQSTKDGMMLALEALGMRIFHLDGQQLMHRLIDGHREVYEVPESK